MPKAMLDDVILEPLTIEELVEQDSSVEDTFHFNEGVWWRKLRPFFYQPAFFFQPIKPKSSSPSFYKAIIGYHHIVPESCQCNSYFKMLMYKNVKGYSFELLPREAKKSIKKSRILKIKRVTDVNDLLTDGYETCVSFRKRTNWGRDKNNYQVFSGWIKKAFKLKKRFFLGAYFNDKLIAYSQPYAIEGIASTAILISHSDYLKYCPNDLMLHTFLTICKNSPDVKMANVGPSSLKPSLDRFKMKYGFEIVKYSTYVWLNPFVKPILKRYYRNKYDQLFGL